MRRGGTSVEQAEPVQGQRQEKEKGKSEGEKTKRGVKKADKGERVTLPFGDE